MSYPEGGNFYDLLGVSHVASAAEIRAAFLRLAQRYHPDLNANDASADRRFKQIRRVYEILSDPLTRAAYDDNPSRFRLDAVNVIADDLGPIVTRPVRSGGGTDWSAGGPGMAASLFRPRWLSDSRFRRENRYVFAAVAVAMVAISLIPMMLAEQRRQAVRPQKPTRYTEPSNSSTLEITNLNHREPQIPTPLEQVMESVGDLRKDHEEPRPKTRTSESEEARQEEVSRPSLESSLDDWPTAFTLYRYPRPASFFPTPGVQGGEAFGGATPIPCYVSRYPEFDRHSWQQPTLNEAPIVPESVYRPSASFGKPPRMYSESELGSVRKGSFGSGSPSRTAATTFTHLQLLNRTAPLAHQGPASVHFGSSLDASHAPWRPTPSKAATAVLPRTGRAFPTHNSAGVPAVSSHFMVPTGAPYSPPATGHRLGQPTSLHPHYAGHQHQSAPTSTLEARGLQQVPQERRIGLPYNPESTLSRPPGAQPGRPPYAPSTPAPRF